MDFKPNQIIDNRYKIIKKLDEGGMGAVWKATDARTNDSIVVLKFPLKYRDPEILERFAREAGTMRELAGDCANILDIQDIGSVAINDIDNVPYYVMRFQTGGALRDWTAPQDDQGNPIYTADTFSWVSGVATALDFLHHQEEAVFHRDVKPENILFDASGTPKLSDFGIVKNIKKATTNITKTGAGMGTVAYMPPEIWRGGDFSPASDQFSFVSTVYEVVAGNRPYNGETPFGMLESLSKGHEKLKDTIGLSPAASNALDKGLSHEPDDRFESCISFANAFLKELYVTEMPTPGPTGGVTGPHVGPIGPSSGGDVIADPPLVPEPPGDEWTGSGGSLFPEPPEPPPVAPKSSSTFYKLRPIVLATMVTLLLVGLVYTAIQMDFRGTGTTSVAISDDSDQQEIERRAQEIADQKLRENAEREAARMEAEQEKEARQKAKEEEAKRQAEAEKQEEARLAAAKEEAKRKEEEEAEREKEEAEEAKREQAAASLQEWKDWYQAALKKVGFSQNELFVSLNGDMEILRDLFPSAFPGSDEPVGRANRLAFSSHLDFDRELPRFMGAASFSDPSDLTDTIEIFEESNSDDSILNDGIEHLMEGDLYVAALSDHEIIFGHKKQLGKILNNCLSKPLQRASAFEKPQSHQVHAMVDARLVRQLVRRVPDDQQQELPPELAQFLDVLESTFGSADALIATLKSSDDDIQIILRTSGADSNSTTRLATELNTVLDLLKLAQGFHEVLQPKVEAIQGQLVFKITMDEIIFKKTIETFLGEDD